MPNQTLFTRKPNGKRNELGTISNKPNGQCPGARCRHIKYASRPTFLLPKNLVIQISSLRAKSNFLSSRKNPRIWSRARKTPEIKINKSWREVEETKVGRLETKKKEPKSTWKAPKKTENRPRRRKTRARRSRMGVRAEKASGRRVGPGRIYKKWSFFRRFMGKSSKLCVL